MFSCGYLFAPTLTEYCFYLLLAHSLIFFCYRRFISVISSFLLHVLGTCDGLVSNLNAELALWKKNKKRIISTCELYKRYIVLTPRLYSQSSQSFRKHFAFESWESSVYKQTTTKNLSAISCQLCAFLCFMGIFSFLKKNVFYNFLLVFTHLAVVSPLFQCKCLKFIYLWWKIYCFL